MRSLYLDAGVTGCRHWAAMFMQLYRPHCIWTQVWPDADIGQTKVAVAINGIDFTDVQAQDYMYCMRLKFLAAL